MKWMYFKQRDLITDEEVLFQYDVWSFMFDYHAHEFLTKVICKWALNKIEDYVYKTITKEQLMRSLKEYKRYIFVDIGDRGFCKIWIDFMQKNILKVRSLEKADK